MEITKTDINKVDPETYGTHLMSVHTVFPELTLHEVQDRIVELVNSPRYADFLNKLHKDDMHRNGSNNGVTSGTIQ